jgi:hypothetical protein
MFTVYNLRALITVFVLKTLASSAGVDRTPLVAATPLGLSLFVLELLSLYLQQLRAGFCPVPTFTEDIFIGIVFQAVDYLFATRLKALLPEVSALFSFFTLCGLGDLSALFIQASIAAWAAASAFFFASALAFMRL